MIKEVVGGVTYPSTQEEGHADVSEGGTVIEEEEEKRDTKRRRRGRGNDILDRNQSTGSERRERYCETIT